MTTDQLIANYRNAGQGQVFAFWESLNANERAELAAQAAEVDLAEVDRLNRTLVFKTGGSGANLDSEIARTSRFVSWPSDSYTSSGSPGTRERALPRYSTAITHRGSESCPDQG